MGSAWERLANLYDFVQLLVAKNKPMLSWTALPEVQWPEHRWECPVLLRTKGNPLDPGAPFWEPHRQGDVQHFRMTALHLEGSSQVLKELETMPWHSRKTVGPTVTSAVCILLEFLTNIHTFYVFLLHSWYSTHALFAFINEHLHILEILPF